MGKWKSILFVFLPAIANFAISSFIAGLAVRKAILKGLPPQEIGKEVLVAILTYNFYWSILQVLFGLLAVKFAGGWGKIREYYREKLDMSSLALVLALIAISQGAIMSFQLLTAYLCYGGWSAYAAYWREAVSRLPLLSKLYFVAVAPFTAGIFEELIWRMYGITELEKYMSSAKANLVQALAFAVWHGFSLHTIATFIIGYVYDLVFIKRRRLACLTAAHVLTDIVGFSFSILA